MNIERLQTLVGLHNSLAIDIKQFQDGRGEIGYDFERSKKALASIADAIVAEAHVVYAEVKS